MGRKKTNINDSTPFGEMANKWLEAKKVYVKPSTLDNYRSKLKNNILPFMASIPCGEISADVITGLIEKEKDLGFSVVYINDIFTLIKSVIEWAHIQYGIPNNIYWMPKLKNKEKKTRPVLTLEEQRILRESLMTEPNNWKLGILIALSMGLRIGEVCALRWENVDLKNNMLYVRHTAQRITADKGTQLVVGPAKSRSSIRDIPLPDFIIPLLNEFQDSADVYLASGTRQIIDPRTMQYRFKQQLNLAGVPNIPFHSLRHSFATRCVEFGMDIKALSEILGHSSTAITMNLYVHPSVEHKRNCMKLFSDNF